MGRSYGRKVLEDLWREKLKRERVEQVDQGSELLRLKKALSIERKAFVLLSDHFVSVALGRLDRKTAKMLRAKARKSARRKSK